jgi:hypothetical protein
MPTDPSVDFSSFLLSLAGTAMVHLGQVHDPATHTHSLDLPLARHTIDVIAMLAEKTRGNLDEDEQKLLQTIQAELHSRYAAAQQKGT